ncbi:BTB/POZ domain-containing protein [Botrytis cinerea]
MSNLLWKYYLEDDVDKFRRILANVANPSHTLKGHGGGPTFSSSFGSKIGSSGGFGTSPKTFGKSRKASGPAGNINGIKRDHAGLTVLHRAASSTAVNAIEFATALIDHPSIDLYIQDTESGWTALHRALYFGNVTIARAIIERDSKDRATGNTGAKPDSSVIKIKDREGNTPFDVYNATIAPRSIREYIREQRLRRHERDDDSNDGDSELLKIDVSEPESIDGDELFAFGSNKNFSLGFGDQDDRQYPERITLKRPDRLLFQFYENYLDSIGNDNLVVGHENFPTTVSELPSMIQNRPIIIQDVVLSKLSSAVLTTDPESNLYMCGFGPGGRLGMGDETTRFNYVPVNQGGLAGKKVSTVALGQNHTLAVSSEGEIFSWGTNTWGQLGYNLPRPALKDEEPFCTTPRQIFGPLKREIIVGIAASAIHSVAHTSSSLFCWGKNEGQLGLMDSDSRSLEAQPIPRRVAASLFKSSIIKVSAINGATICLLENHTVCVFTNYGYNMVKFPLHESFTNYYLQSTSFTTRYDNESNNIINIESGGDTIAAISGRGDLYTLNVRKVDTKVAAASTTNPSKIKEALSQPQRVWSLRKGNWDGIKSVGVAENGSVIVCTQAGAVWRRVKRAKNKDSFTGNSNYDRKDFKFQRVPGLTKVVAVRSNPFGVFAAIRKDCDVTRIQVRIEDERLLEDLEPLSSIKDLVASEYPAEQHAKWQGRFDNLASEYGSVMAAVITSPDLEGDVEHLFMGQNFDSGYDIEICTSTSDIAIPVHSFLVAGRSSVLRSLLAEFRHSGNASLPDRSKSEPDILNIQNGTSDRIKITFNGLDFITLVNLVIFLYQDEVADVWNFANYYPHLAFRYRKVRGQLMELGSYLNMEYLNGPGLHRRPSDSITTDMDNAIKDEKFFDDCDALVELDGGEIPIHSALACQRCPFFDGLFNGRSGGQWLVGRRSESTGPIRIDLKHIAPETFEVVLRYLYVDIGPELFDHIVSPDIDEFSELILDVMSVANELMIDRLSQICQHVLGRFVTTRNVCNIVNAIAPCSIIELKHAGLEYMCLQLESMLENHLLDDLDEELVLELDEVVRDNQLHCLPFAKSGRADLDLHEKYPELAEDIDEERRRRLGDMMFRTHLKDDDSRLSSSFKMRMGSIDDNMSSPSNEKTRRKSRAAKNEPFSPSIRPKDVAADFMFDMDDDELPGSPPDLNLTIDLTSASPGGPATPSSVGLGIKYPPDTPQSATKTWSSPNLSLKLDMKEIMAQASTSRTSNLSLSLSAQKAKDEEATAKSATPRLSQKERKEKASSPWQVAGVGSRTNLKDILDKENKSSPVALAPFSTISPAISPVNTPSTTRRVASPDTRFAGQKRNDSASITKAQKPSPGPSKQTIPSSRSTPLVPHSKSYKAPTSKAEPSLQLSMADIIGMQQREQEVIKEAVAKRSLQEIQEEQQFQEWWDQESKRAMEEEAQRMKVSSNGAGRGGAKSSGGRGKSGTRGRGGRGRGGGGGGETVKVGGGGEPVKGGGSGGGGNGRRGRGKPQEKTNVAK